MTTSTKELSQMLDEIAKSADWHESLDTVSINRINQAAQRLRELESQITELELQLLTERGAKAWKDAPDATAFFEELRGNKEST